MKKTINFNIKQMKNIFLMIILLLPFFQPGISLYIQIGNFKGFSFVYQILKIISIFTFFLIHRKLIYLNGSKRTSFFLIVIYSMGISIANFIHTKELIHFSTMIFFMGFSYMCFYFIKINKILFLKTIIVLFGIYNFLQLISVILYYPYGITNYVGTFWDDTLAGAKYFFGSKNQAIFYMLMFILCIIIKNHIENKNFPKRIYIYIFIFLIEVSILKSSNSIACLLLFLVYSLIIQIGLQKIIRFLFSPFSYLVLSIIVFLIICILGKADQIKIINDVLNMLGRNATFTNRIYIWDITLNGFLSNPLIGVGEVEIKVMDSIQVQAHNVYLDIMYKYGIITITSYLSILIYSAAQLNKYKKYQIGAFFTVLYFIMMIHNCFDTMDNYLFILFVVLLCLIENRSNTNFKPLKKIKGGEIYE